MGYRAPRPDLHQSSGHHLGSHPLVELSDRKNEPTAFVQKCRRPRKCKCLILYERRPAEAKTKICGSQRARASCGTNGIEQVKDFLRLHLRSHRNLSGIERWNAGSNRSGTRYYTTHSRREVVCALVAVHL